MSGICGIVQLDGRTIAKAELAPLLAGLELRGPDGTRAWQESGATLGHASLATTPEALIEQLPLLHSHTGCTITADARLDNRSDLIEALGPSQRDRAVGDGELILHSYLKWGTSCAEHLAGDFAFAIWDPREKLLFCARDLIGMRQLIYHHAPGKLFAFATEPEALLQHPSIERRINEERIADFLENLEAHDLTSTFYVGLQKLPRAHAMVVQQSGVRAWQYTRLNQPEKLMLPDDSAYAEAFMDVFETAIRDRLRSPEPVGSMLSGGMDSGSVSAVAARLLKEAGQTPLATFSATGTAAACPETLAIGAATQMDHIDPHVVSLGDVDSYRAELEALIRNCAEPFDGHMTLPMAVYLAAQRAGRKVVLDGVGGDTTLGTQNMVTWNLRRGRFAQAWREARGEEEFWEYPEPAIRAFVRGLGQIGIPKAIRELRHEYRRRRIQRRPQADSLLSKSFAERIGLDERIQANAAHVANPAGDSFEDRQRRVLHPYVTVARERYDRVASALGIEPRDPFLDRRVMEFCCSLPADQLQRNGWPKFILRNAMRGRLPDAVRWRSGKEHLGWDFTKSVYSQQDIEATADLEEAVYRYVNKAKIGDVKSLTGDDSAFAQALTTRYLSDWISARGEPI